VKIGDFPLVESLMSERAVLVDQREERVVRLEIGRRMMDPAFAQALRPAIEAELGRRIADVDEQLRQLGVDVG
jgi:hypothetical protein